MSPRATDFSDAHSWEKLNFLFMYFNLIETGIQEIIQAKLDAALKNPPFFSLESACFVLSDKEGRGCHLEALLIPALTVMLREGSWVPTLGSQSVLAKPRLSAKSPGDSCWRLVQAANLGGGGGGFSGGTVHKGRAGWKVTLQQGPRGRPRAAQGPPAGNVSGGVSSESWPRAPRRVCAERHGLEAPGPDSPAAPAPGNQEQGLGHFRAYIGVIC